MCVIFRKSGSADAIRTKARLLIEKLQTEYPFPIYWDTPENTARNSNILVTTTPSRHYYIDKNWIVPGTFIAAIGADSPGKQELSPELVASSVIVADIKKQVCQVGESQHALRESLISPDDIYAELGEIVTGRKNVPNRGKRSFTIQPELHCKTSVSVSTYIIC